MQGAERSFSVLAYGPSTKRLGHKFEQGNQVPNLHYYVGGSILQGTEAIVEPTRPFNPATEWHIFRM